MPDAGELTHSELVWLTTWQLAQSRAALRATEHHIKVSRSVIAESRRRLAETVLDKPWLVPATTRRRNGGQSDESPGLQVETDLPPPACARMTDTGRRPTRGWRASSAGRARGNAIRAAQARRRGCA